MTLNVLMILADQHHAGLMGCCGHPQVITPNLDRFAADGVRFTDAYTQNPICTPSRTSILSGQYCHNHTIYGLSGPSIGLPSNLFREFRRAGYRTAALGKTHLPNYPRDWVADDVDFFDDAYHDEFGRKEQSAFFRYLESLGLRHLEDSYYNAEHYGPGRAISHDATVSDLPYEHTHERFHARRALEFIDTEPDKPFCIQLNFQKPHHPLLPQKQFWDMYPEDISLPETFNLNPAHRPPHFQEMWQKFREYEFTYAREGDTFEDGARRAWRGTLACITQVDDVVGRVLNHLKQNGRLDDTIVIYGSDHGCYHSIHGIQEKAPGICSDAVCRVPMIWRVPGVKPRVCDALVENVDMTPTLLSLCGLAPLVSADGVDLTPLLHARVSSVKDEAVTENVLSKSIRWDRYRYVHYPKVMFPGGDEGELYDLTADPMEKVNLYHQADYQHLVQEGKHRLLDWLIRTAQVRHRMPLQMPDLDVIWNKGGTFSATYDIPKQLIYM